MLQYLSVKRPAPNDKNGRDFKGLPLDLKSVFELVDSKIPVADKFRIIFEQVILAQLILDMSESTDYRTKDYLVSLDRISKICLPQQINSMDSSLYGKYKKTLSGILEKNKSSMYDAISVLKDYVHFSKESCQLSEDFYVPYLQIASGRVGNKNKDHVYDSAVLLTPYLEKCEGGNRIVFSSQIFTTCHLHDPLPITKLSPIMEYILRLDWKGKNWIQFTDVVQSYGLNTHNKFESHQSLSGTLANILYRDFNKTLISPVVRTQYISCLKYLEQHYRIGIDSFESMYWVLSGLGYKGLEFLISKNPTNRELVGFENYSELEFIKQYKLQVALEAADTDEDKEEETEEKPEEKPEEKSDEPDDLEDDPETDPDEETSDDSTDTDADSDEALPEADDLTGEGESEPAGDSTGTGAGDSAEQTDTPSDPEDPFSIAFNVTKSETMSEYFQRESLCSTLTSMVNNPPESMSVETVAFLRVWLTQWINLVSIDTTKAILSKLAVTIDL